MEALAIDEITHNYNTPLSEHGSSFETLFSTVVSEVVECRRDRNVVPRSL